MASPINSGSFQARSTAIQHDHTLTTLHGDMHTMRPTANRSIHSNYSQSAMAQSHVVPPFEGIVDFTYSQSLSQYPAASDQHHAPMHRPDGAEWKQSSFFSYRPNEVKHRKRTTRQQLKVLEETFRTTQKPDGNVRKSLALQLDMTPRNVQVWFQNRRAKDKTLAKRALKGVDESDAKDLDAPATEQPTNSMIQDSFGAMISPIESLNGSSYTQSEILSPHASVSNSSTVSPVEGAFRHHSTSTVAFSSTQSLSAGFSDGMSYGADGRPNRAAEYPKDIYGPRGSLPHIQAVPYSQDLQHQRSNSSPAFLSNVDTSSNLSLTTYASINGVLYPQQRFTSPLSQQAHHMYHTSLPPRVPGLPSGPLPTADYAFGMPVHAEGDKDFDATNIGHYSQFGSMSGSDTPSSLSHYGSVASFTESDSASFGTHGYEEDVTSAPIGWQPKQRRGSYGLQQGSISSRGYSPLSVAYTNPSPRPGSAPSTDQESEGADTAIYMAGHQAWPTAYPEEMKPSIAYQQDVFAYNVGEQQPPYTFVQTAPTLSGYASMPMETQYASNNQVSIDGYRPNTTGYQYA
jgi:hypothetical protein